jgi:hypothetical protein
MITGVFIGNGTFVVIHCQAANLTLEDIENRPKSADNRTSLVKRPKRLILGL